MDHVLQNNARIIYTIGHSNHSIETFLDLLKQHTIEVLIDTRSFPFSRYSPHFNKDSLKASLEISNIKYGYYGRQLGGRPEDEDYYDERGHVDYAKMARSFLFNEGLERLLSGIERFRTAILCSEENPSVCHRRLLVSRALYENGIEVYHIRGDGSIDSEAELLAKEAKLEIERQERAAEKDRVAILNQQAKIALQTAKRELREEAERLKRQKILEREVARQIKMQQKQGAGHNTQRDKDHRMAIQPKLFDMEDS